MASVNSWNDRFLLAGKIVASDAAKVFARLLLSASHGKTKSGTEPHLPLSRHHPVCLRSQSRALRPGRAYE